MGVFCCCVANSLSEVKKHGGTCHGNNKNTEDSILLPLMKSIGKGKSMHGKVVPNDSGLISSPVSKNYDFEKMS